MVCSAWPSWRRAPGPSCACSELRMPLSSDSTRLWPAPKLSPSKCFAAVCWSWSTSALALTISSIAFFIDLVRFEVLKNSASRALTEVRVMSSWVMPPRMPKAQRKPFFGQNPQAAPAGSRNSKRAAKLEKRQRECLIEFLSLQCCTVRPVAGRLAREQPRHEAARDDSRHSVEWRLEGPGTGRSEPYILNSA